MSNKFEKLDYEFEKHVQNNTMNINCIEDLMLNEIDNFKNELKTHIEKLISNKINEKELISKKNKNGKKKSLN